MAGDDFVEELDLDITVPAAAQAALALYVGSMLDELRRELPVIWAQPEVLGGLIRLIVASSRAAARERPS